MKLHQPVRLEEFFTSKCHYCSGAAVWKVGEFKVCNEHAMKPNQIAAGWNMAAENLT